MILKSSAWNSCVWGIGLLAAFGSTQPDQTLRVMRRFAAPEATQAVAVDGKFFYAIASAAIAKYDKRTGRQTARWEETRGGPIAHLNSGTIIGNELYSAHSNYPETPMVSSIEVFDTKRMVHLRTVALPSGLGSATWVARKGNEWWVTFAHYAGRGGEAGKGPEFSRLVRFDSEWRQRGAWSFPPAVVAKWDGMSSSGGVWVREQLYTTGHHAPELYVLALPASGTELTLKRIVPFESEGQGIAFDRSRGLLYSIQRRTHEVLVSKLH